MKVVAAKPSVRLANEREEALAPGTIANPRRVIHPVHAVLLASTLPLFLGALLSDWAYSSTYQIQWTNFASWQVAGGLVFTGLALLWAIIDSFRVGPNWLYLGLLVALLRPDTRSRRSPRTSRYRVRPWSSPTATSSSPKARAVARRC